MEFSAEYRVYGEESKYVPQILQKTKHLRSLAGVCCDEFTKMTKSFKWYSEHGHMYFANPEQGWDGHQNYTAKTMPKRGSAAMFYYQTYERTMKNRTDTPHVRKNQYMYDPDIGSKMFDVPSDPRVHDKNFYTDMEMLDDCIHKMPRPNMHLISDKQNPLNDDAFKVVGGGKMYDPVLGKTNHGSAALLNLIKIINIVTENPPSRMPSTVMDLQLFLAEMYDILFVKEDQGSLKEQVTKKQFEIPYIKRQRARGMNTSDGSEAIRIFTGSELLVELHKVEVDLKGDEHAAANARCIFKISPVHAALKYYPEQLAKQVASQYTNVVIDKGGEERKAEVENVATFMDVAIKNGDEMMVGSLDLTKYNENQHEKGKCKVEIAMYYGFLTTDKLMMQINWYMHWHQLTAVCIPDVKVMNCRRQRRVKFQELKEKIKSGNVIFLNKAMEKTLRFILPYTSDKGLSTNSATMLMGMRNIMSSLVHYICLDYAVKLAAKITFGNMYDVQYKCSLSSDDVVAVFIFPYKKERITPENKNCIRRFMQVMFDIEWKLGWTTSPKKTSMCNKPYFEYNSLVYTQRGVVSEVNFLVGGFHAGGECMRTDQTDMTAKLRLLKEKVTSSTVIVASQVCVNNFRYTYDIPVIANYENMTGEHRELVMKAKSVGFTPRNAPISMGGNLKTAGTNFWRDDLAICIQRLKNEGHQDIAHELLRPDTAFVTAYTPSVQSAYSTKEFVTETTTNPVFDCNMRPKAKTVTRNVDHAEDDHHQRLIKMTLSITDPQQLVHPKNTTQTIYSSIQQTILELEGGIMEHENLVSQADAFEEEDMRFEEPADYE